MKRMFSAAGLILAAMCWIHSGVLSAETVEAPKPMPGLQIGDTAPNFSGDAYEGGTVTLSDLYAKGPVVLIFYRGAWCPYCNLHLKSFQEKLPEIQALGAQVLAVSVDLKEYANETVQKNGLGFEVVSNPDADILKSYGLVFHVPAELEKKYREEYHIDLEKHSGRKDFLIAIPATYVIDTDGRIVFAYASEDYKVRTKPEEVVDVLKSMQDHG